MKKVTSLFILVFMSLDMLAQLPQSFKYQTVARNIAGEILASKNISFRMTILLGDLPGTVVYTEIHAATTNSLGLATLVIGRGAPVTGSFAIISWSTYQFNLIELPKGVYFVRLSATGLVGMKKIVVI